MELKANILVWKRTKVVYPDTSDSFMRMDELGFKMDSSSCASARNPTVEIDLIREKL